MREKGGEAKALQIWQYIENRLLIIYKTLTLIGMRGDTFISL